MTQPAYSQLYLHDAMRNLGACFDYAINDCNYTPDFFMSLFTSSGLSIQYGNCNPHFICGISGTELAMEVLREVTDKIYFPEPQPKYDRSPEYWSGWVLAYAQWKVNISFEEIQRVFPLSEIISCYNPLHEADESQFVDVLIEKMHQNPTYRRINEYRKKLGLSQKELSEKSGINLRSIQQYEIGAKDINKASYRTIRTIEKCLYTTLSHY